MFVLDPTRWWECPSCPFQHVTKISGRISPTHDCPAHHGISVPLVAVATNAGIERGVVRHVVLERGDMIGAEQGVRHDARGRAVMGVLTERADGSNDAVAFPASATLTIERKR